jgi:hypothetical protein
MERYTVGSLVFGEDNLICGLGLRSRIGRIGWIGVSLVMSLYTKISPVGTPSIIQ